MDGSGGGFVRLSLRHSSWDCRHSAAFQFPPSSIAAACDATRCTMLVSAAARQLTVLKFVHVHDLPASHTQYQRMLRLVNTQPCDAACRDGCSCSPLKRCARPSATAADPASRAIHVRLRNVFVCYAENCNILTMRVDACFESDVVPVLMSLCLPNSFFFLF